MRTKYHEHIETIVTALHECDLPGDTVERILESASKIIHGFGVEQGKEGAEECQYVNVGETYMQTLIHYNGAFRLQSFGDWVEEMDRKQAESGLFRCAYCGAYNEKRDGPKYDEPICKDCGKFITG